MKKKMTKVIAKVISTVLVVTLVIGLSPAILAESAYHTETPATRSQTDNESSETTTPEEDTTNEESTTQGIVPFTDAGPLIRNNTPSKGRSITALAQGEETGLILDKTAKVESVEKDTYSINMEAFVTGKMKSEPADIILVLDESGSMKQNLMGTAAKYEGVNYNQLDKSKYYYVSNYYDGYKNIYYNGENWVDEMGKVYDTNSKIYKSTSKHQILINSVRKFVDLLSADASDNGVDHRIAMVSFSTASDGRVEDSRYLTGSPNNAYRSVVNEKQDLYAAGNKLMIEGATNTAAGMTKANSILKNQVDETTPRNKIVILFTDGVPTTMSAFDKGVADKAIKQAEIAKQESATVYTIGVINGAKPETTTVMKGYDSNAPEPDKLNKFMHYVSSNFKYKMDAPLRMDEMKRLTVDNIQEGSNEGYYLSATNEASLNKIFENITKQIMSTVKLDKETVLKDVITKYFKIEEDITKIKVSTIDYLGDGNWNLNSKNDITGQVKVTSDFENNTITVKGFDYSANALFEKTVNTEASGKKLIVEVGPFTRADGFIGGNQVPTNTSDSGVTNEKVHVYEKFPEPFVDVLLKYYIKTQPQSIFVGNQWNEVQKFFIANNTLIYSIDGKPYTVSGTNNEFVDIVYNVKDKNGAIGQYEVKAGKTNGLWKPDSKYKLNTVNLIDTKPFTIDAVITPVPRGNGKVEAIKPTQLANLYIFKPAFSISDEYVFLGDTTNLLERLPDDKNDIAWSCADEKAPQPEESTKPELQFELKNIAGTPVGTDLAQYAPKKDADFKVKVVNGNTDTDITGSTTIMNEDGKDDEHDFTIYVVKGQLEITKSIDRQYTTAEAKNANQTFLFKIERSLEKTGEVVETFYQTLDFSANEGNTIKSVNIKGLPKGYYTVSEVNDWSWNYNEIAGSRNDNYKGNGTISGVSENSMIFIGDKDKNNTTGFTFYGTEVGTVIRGKNEALPAQTAFVNKLGDKKILSDTASAVNTFQSFNKMVSGLNKFKKYR